MSGQPALGRRGPAYTPGGGSADRSTLPLTVIGTPSIATNASGTIHSGSRSRRRAASALSAIAAALRCRATYATSRAPTGPLIHDDHALTDGTGWAQQRRLDLAGLDPVPAHLDLAVGAAEELDARRRRGQRARSPVR